MMETAVHRCPKCSKTFASDKALHGHMRLHPKGSYQGINPPDNAAKSKAARKECSTAGSYSSNGSDSDASDNSPGRTYKQILNFRADLEAFYKNWETEEYYEGDGSQYEARYIRTLNLEEYDPRFRRFCKRFISEALEKEEEGKEEEGGTKMTIRPTMTMSNIGTSNAAATETNAQKKRKVCEIGRNTNNGGQHVCATCKMTFTSHQALGGHQTLHRQKSSASSAPTAKKATEAKAHICEICKLEFWCGQALGGHKRLHYEGPLHKSARKREVEKSMSRSSSASIHSSDTNGDDYEYEEGVPSSSDDSTAAQLELEMQAEVEDDGSKGHNLLAAFQSKLEMQVEVEDEVGSKGCGFDLNVEIIHKEAEVVEDGEEKGVMVTNKTHADPRSNHAHQDRNINFPSPPPQLPDQEHV